MSELIHAMRNLAANEELYRECLLTFGHEHSVTQAALTRMHDAGDEAREILKSLDDAP